MAKVKIQGHASGSGVFTVTAPNSNTDRTITLPDADVTLGTDATKLPLAGGALTGAVTTNSTFDGRDVAADGVLATNALPKAGGTMTGSINMVVGSEASPSIRFAGDTNTGIWSPAADTLAISAGGSERMRMLSDGTLCIGETSAGLSLDTQLFVRNNDGNGYAATFLNDGDDAGRWGIAIACGADAPNATDNYPIRFLDGNGTEVGKVTFDNVGTSYHGVNTAKAWVNFNGTNTVAIRDSHNVSSITDNATGNYSTNYSNNMANVNYSVLVSSNGGGGDAYAGSWGDTDMTCPAVFSMTVSKYQQISYELGVGYFDCNLLMGTVFGD